MAVDPIIETNAEVPAAALTELEATLARLTAEKDDLAAHMAAEVREAGAKVAPGFSMNPDLLRRIGLVALVGALLLTLSLVLNPRTGQPATRGIALAIVGCMAIVAGKVQEREQKRRRALLEEQARAESQAEHGATLAALAAEIADTEASIARLRDEAERLARQG